MGWGRYRGSYGRSSGYTASRSYSGGRGYFDFVKVPAASDLAVARFQNANIVLKWGNEGKATTNFFNAFETAGFKVSYFENQKQLTADPKNSILVLFDFKKARNPKMVAACLKNKTALPVYWKDLSEHLVALKKESENPGKVPVRPLTEIIKERANGALSGLTFWQQFSTGDNEWDVFKKIGEIKRQGARCITFYKDGMGVRPDFKLFKSPDRALDYIPNDKGNIHDGYQCFVLDKAPSTYSVRPEESKAWGEKYSVESLINELQNIKLIESL